MKKLAFAQAAMVALAFSTAMVSTADAQRFNRYRNQAAVTQQGVNNGAAIVQNGNGNNAGVRQYGDANNGAVTQNGNNNNGCLIQVGRGLDGAITQTGNNNDLAVVQTQNGANVVNPAFCQQGATIRGGAFNTLAAALRARGG